MKVNRREFIRITGAATTGLAVSGLGFDLHLDIRAREMGFAPGNALFVQI